MANSKRTTKGIVALILAMVLTISSILVCPFVASAVSTPAELESTAVRFWADPENSLTQNDIAAYTSGSSKTTMVGAVGVFKRSNSNTNNYYLFLPSNADLTKLKVWFPIGSSASIDGVELENGKPTNIFEELNEGGIAKDYTLVLDSKSYSVKVMKSGEIGAVYIDTVSGSISSLNSKDHTTSTTGTIMVVDEKGVIQYDGAMEKMSGRGNGTWSESNKKNPYNVKLATSTSLLGMPKAKKWVLLANAGDGSLVRNQISYDFAKYIGVKYQPICKPVDLYVNQQYYGSYSLSEKVEIKSNRINISDAYENLEIANGTVDANTGIVTPADLSKLADVKAVTSAGTTTVGATGTFGHTVGNRKYATGISDLDDYTGGYLYELEISKRWPDENAGFCAYNRQGWVIKSANYATKNMVDYSYDLLYALGASVYNNGIVPNKSITTNCSDLSTLSVTRYGLNSITNPAPDTKYQGMKWSDLLDADSAVKYYWTQEYFKNMDSSTSSTYFYKESDKIDSKIYAGPVWDMDNAIGYGKNGSRWGHSYTTTDDWYTKYSRIYRWRSGDSTTSYSSDTTSPKNLYSALAMNCDDFWAMAENQWYSTMKPAIDVLLGNKVDPTGTLHETSYYVNMVSKSAKMNDYKVHDNGTGEYNAQGFIDGFNNWFADREQWIDGEIGTVDINQAEVSSIDAQVCNGKELKPELTITYKNTTLVKGQDYTVSYSNNVGAGVGIATVTGMGHFSGILSEGFTISKGVLDSAEVTQLAYAGDTVEATVKTTDGSVIYDFINYQWKSNGEDIPNANSSSYTVDEKYARTSLTVEVTGDGINIESNPVLSNVCTINEGEKPNGFTKSIAEWNYDFTANEDGLTNSDETGQTYYYTATDGEKASVSRLVASVNGAVPAKIKWSGVTDLYTNSNNSVFSDQAPVMSTSKTDGLAWGEHPYFETVVSTTGFENIMFSAKLGGTKKGPKDWKLEYSLDGENYKSVATPQYEITENKALNYAFNDVIMPIECSNQSRVYIRMSVCSNVAINKLNAIKGSTSGDAAINNVKISGTSTTVITSLSQPEISTNSVLEDSTQMYSGNKIKLTDTNGGCGMYYTINDGEVHQYEGIFIPFNSKTNSVGDTAVIKAWAQHNDIKSVESEITVTYMGVALNQWQYDNYCQNVSNGYVFSNGGAYGESGKMSAYADVYQYVPRYNVDNGAFVVSPDDGAMWCSKSGFYFEISTAGYSNVAFSAMAYTTGQGPKSVQLQYSLDNNNWKSVGENVDLTATGQLKQAYLLAQLPGECSNQSKLYIRVVTVENATYGGNTLHYNASKGNLYMNYITVSANDDDESLKMPYTNKTSHYFSSAIKYKSIDSQPIKYLVADKNSNIIMSGDYDVENGIDITKYEKFNMWDAGPYTVSVWEGDSDDRSQINTQKYYYKGKTVTKFNLNSTSKLLSDYIDETGTELSNTSGTNAGKLYMSPNGIDKASLTYTDAYGIKVVWASDNRFTSTKKLDKPDGNGYWMMELNTQGYAGLTLNMEQISSNKGPRDWGVAYSLDGENYTYVKNSNVSAISNDATATPIETYNNLPLPSECDNQEKVYIKVFINGGESVDGTELETVLKGNTGANGVEISGVPLPQIFDVRFNLVGIENMEGTAGTNPVDGWVFVNDNAYETTDGYVDVKMTEGETYTYYASANEKATFASDKNSITVVASDEKQIAILPYDINGDQIINAKDYSYINKSAKYENSREYLNTNFAKFYNLTQADFLTE